MELKIKLKRSYSGHDIHQSIPNKEKIGLIQDASLEQNGTTITGDRIDYDLKSEIVKASSSENTKQRIEMVIPPTR